MHKERHKKEKRPLNYFEGAHDSLDTLQFVLGNACAHILISLLGEQKYYQLRRKSKGNHRNK